MPMKEMASLLMCEPSNVTGIIDKLFARSYIAREENPKDRRIKMISLTDEGTELRQKIVKNIVDYKSDRLERLTPAEQQDLKKMMLKILA
jgi:DNA-binding MarR family transcriptional regulator